VKPSDMGDTCSLLSVRRSASRLESVISLAAFACLQFMAFESRQISIVERSRSSFLFQCCVQVFLSPGVAIGSSQWEVQTLSAGIHTGAHHWCSVPKKVFTSRAM
jgi:hypothetical protein